MVTRGECSGSIGLLRAGSSPGDRVNELKNAGFKEAPRFGFMLNIYNKARDGAICPQHLSYRNLFTWRLTHEGVAEFPHHPFNSPLMNIDICSTQVAQ